MDDELKRHTFYEKHLATDGVADEEWKGYLVWVSGGNNKQGFPIK